MRKLLHIIAVDARDMLTAIQMRKWKYALPGPLFRLVSGQPRTDTHCKYEDCPL